MEIDVIKLADEGHHQPKDLDLFAETLESMASRVNFRGEYKNWAWCVIVEGVHVRISQGIFVFTKDPIL